MPLVSIIIPVFNVEKYLSVCVESILQQSFSDFELLLIDDGSKDNSGSICDEYANLDKRIHVFHKKNGGASSARNMGIRKTNTEWITFIDADDLVGANYLKGLFLPIMENHQVDFVHGGCTNYENGKRTAINQFYDYYVGSDKGKLFSMFRGLVVSKLFKTKIIKEIKLLFDEKMSIAEDMAFTMDYLLYCNKYAFVPEASYYYRRDNVDSVTHKVIQTSFELEKHNFDHLYNSTMAFIKKYNIMETDSQLRYEQRAKQYLFMLQSMYRDKSYNKQKRLQILQEESGSDHFILLNYLKKEGLEHLFMTLLLNHRFKCFDIIQRNKTLVSIISKLVSTQ